MGGGASVPEGKVQMYSAESLALLGAGQCV